MIARDMTDIDWEEVSLHHDRTLEALRVKDSHVAFEIDGFPHWYEILKELIDREQRRDNTSNGAEVNHPA